MSVADPQYANLLEQDNFVTPEPFSLLTNGKVRALQHSIHRKTDESHSKNRLTGTQLFLCLLTAASRHESQKSQFFMLKIRVVHLSIVLAPIP